MSLMKDAVLWTRGLIKILVNKPRDAFGEVTVA